MTLRRTLSVACLTVVGSAVLTLPAQASPGDAVAEGNAGSVRIGSRILAPVAPCSTESTLENSSSSTSVPNTVFYSDIDSTCTIDEFGEIATATITGGTFRFDALRQYQGPRVRLSSYTARCEARPSGSRASFTFSGLSGVKTPTRIPANYVVTIPGAGGPNDRPMATVTFNETIVPSPPDGSVTVHLMHIRMFPRGGPTSGDAFVGTVHCSPVS